MRQWLSIYTKGIFMGAADIVPGVSGGTIALIVGIYPRLVNAIASLDPRVLLDIPALVSPDGRSDVVAKLQSMDLPFLIVLGAGIATAFVVLSRFIQLAFEGYPALVNAFFFGLIGASAIVLSRDMSLATPGRTLVALAGFSIAFIVAGIASGDGNGSLPVIFLAGAIAISAMVLPGISGAAFLYLLGQYYYMLSALQAFLGGIRTLLTGGGSTDLIESGIIVGTFMAGAVIGLLSTAHVISYALATFRRATIVFLVSLMVGALRLPIEEVYAETGIPDGMTAVSIVVVASIGVLAVLALDYTTGGLTYGDP